MLILKNIDFQYENIELLKNISFSINKGECVCLVGSNGSGKSTLLKCIIGELKINNGSLIIGKGVKIGYLPQETLVKNMSMGDYLFSNFNDLLAIKRKIDLGFSHLLEYPDFITKYVELGGYEIEQEIKKLAKKFGFGEDDLTKDIEIFSQGQKRLIDLLKLKLENADLYILDEPTNHLDISAVLLLENFIQERKRKDKAFLIVSHDRCMIDKISDKTVYINRGISIEIKGGYTEALQHLEHEFESKKKFAEDIQKKIVQLEREVVRLKNKTISTEKREHKKQIIKKSKYARSDKAYLTSKATKIRKRTTILNNRAENMIEKLEKEKPFIEKKLNLSFDDYSVTNRLLFRAENLSKSFNNIIILNDVNLEIESKDRIGIIGANGCGKSTLFKCLIKELKPDIGSMYRNNLVKLLYFPQNSHKFFKKDILLENMDCNQEESVIRQYLGAAKIRGEKALQSVKTLSYGELMRAIIVYAILNQVEFLVMDEPTNNLDIESLEILDELLEKFPGGMLYASHDRTFIAKNSQKLFKLNNGNLKWISVI